MMVESISGLETVHVSKFSLPGACEGEVKTEERVRRQMGEKRVESLLFRKRWVNQFLRCWVFVKSFKDNDRHQLDLNHVPKCWPRCHIFFQKVLLRCGAWWAEPRRWLRNWPPSHQRPLQSRHKIISYLISIMSPEQAPVNIISYLYHHSRVGTR